MPAFNEYVNPALTVDVVVFGYQEERLSVLLLNRKEEPFNGGWTLPGAFLLPGEELQDACGRVLQNKLGVGRLYLEQLYTFDAINRDPRGRVVSVAHFALVNAGSLQLAAGSMANDVQWKEINRLPPLGFDHKAIFKMALQRLRAKMLYQPVGFNLLDEHFTMSELHRLYECVLNTEIDRRNFSRKILDAGYVINTGKKREGAKNRHPDLFRFNRKLKSSNFSLNIQTS